MSPKCRFRLSLPPALTLSRFFLHQISEKKYCLAGIGDVMTKHVTLKQLDRITFAAKGDSNHWVMMDGPESVGGTDAASRPKELILYALAGCTASDVVTILMKKRVPLQGFEMHLTGHEAEEHPRSLRIFTLSMSSSVRKSNLRTLSAQLSSRPRSTARSRQCSRQR